MYQDVSVTRDGFSNDLQQDRQHEIMLDSIISQTRHVEVERELERWVPDEDVPQCPELENIFDGHWNRLLLLSFPPFWSRGLVSPYLS